MKCLRSFFIVLLFTTFFCNSSKIYAQWELFLNPITSNAYRFGGNSNSTYPVSFVHDADSTVSEFRWYTRDGLLQERMRLTQLGRIGLNTTTPSSLFHMDDGTFLATGTVGSNPDLGAGSRMMWIPELSAFRAGQATGAEWDDPNIGLNSMALGRNVTASGENSTTLGANSISEGLNSFSAGAGNYSEGTGSFTIGTDNYSEGLSCGAIGNDVHVDGDFSYGFGKRIKFTEEGSITIGTGSIAPIAPLSNPVQHSFLVGMNSDIPTLFISDSGGAGSFGRVGLGNITAPTHLLDVNGEVRIRQMENDSIDVLITGTEQDTLGGDYVLKYLEFSGDQDQYLAGNGTWQDVEDAICEWDSDGTNLTTGYTGGCHEGNVGIGVDTPTAKLDVFENFSGQSGLNIGERIAVLGGEEATFGLHVTLGTGVILPSVVTYGVYGRSQGGIEKNFGGYFTAINSLEGVSSQSTGCMGISASDVDLTASNFGVQGMAANGRNNYGVFGSIESHPNGARSYGVYGEATNNGVDNSSTGTIIGVLGYGQSQSGTECSYNVYGVYGKVSPNPCPSTLLYAGYFKGDVEVTGQLTTGNAPVLTSDISLKTNIEDVENALEKVMELKPKTYNWNQDATLTLDFTDERACGFIAQEVQEIFPDMVKTVRTAPVFDEETNEVIAEGEEFLGLKYDELIPILTKAIQEQQSQLDAQQAQLDALSTELAACCASGMDARSGEVQDDIRMESLPSKHSLEQNAPNPFTTNTTLRFTMSNQAHARVCIYNSNGQIIDCLVDETKAEGQHRIDWDTSDLAPGIYFYSLEVDGFEQVRRAVKL